MGLRLNPVVSGQYLHCLALHLLGCHAGFRHDVTAFTQQAFVHRQMIVSG